MAAGLVGCDAEPNAPLTQLEPKRAPVETVAKVLDFDAAEFETKVDPVAPPGDLRAEMEAFTSVGACVEQRSRIDPMLGDAIEAIGYDTFFADACRVVDAAKAGDAKRCQGIATSALREHCRATVAELRADPNACPWTQPRRPSLGRDPTCVAIAARIAPLCGVEHDPVERAVCVALLEPAPRGATGCAKLFSRAQRDRCTRAIARWRSALSPGKAPVDAAAILAPSGTFRVEGGEGDGGATAIDLTREVERGTVLVQQREGTSFLLGTLPDNGPTFLVPPPNGGATFGIEIDVPSGRDATHEARVRRLELLVPGRAPLTLQSEAAAGLKLHIDPLGLERGGPVTLTLEGQVRGESAKLHLEVATFVRDVVTAADILAAATRHEDDVASDGAGP
jgi:hypothetical protein